MLTTSRLPSFEDYNMAGRTYRYFDGDPLYPFGYGLSYTKFAYEGLKFSADKIKTDGSVTVSATVTNVGDKAGDEVVQLYVRDVEADVPVAIRSLQGFKRIHLESGEKAEVSFTLEPRQLSLIDDNDKRVVEPGEFEISVGGGQPIEATGEGNFVTGTLEVTA